MTQFVEQLRNQAKWYAQPGHNARDLMDSRLLEKAADEIERLAAKLEAAEKERDEFKRACFGHISDNSMLRAKITEMEKQEPVGTLHDDGCFVWRETAPHQSNYAGWKMALYALPGARGEEK